MTNQIRQSEALLSARNDYRWRSRAVVFLFFLGFVALIGRALWIQGLNSSFYISHGRSRTERRTLLVAPRARIVDRNGNVLAISEPVYDLWVDPKFFVNASLDQIRFLAIALSVSQARISQYQHEQSRFIYLKRTVATEQALELLAEHIPGVYGLKNEKRYFPEGKLAAQVVGIAGRAGNGEEGVELAANGRLRSKSETRTVTVDRLGNVVADPEYRGLPVPPSDVVLSIDRNVQRMAFDALSTGVEKSKAKAGCAAVIDTNTGEILALVNLPTFDPNAPSADGLSPLRNRALTDAFEPGSTIKPIVVALALDKGIIGTNTRFDTSPGVLHFHGSTIHDTSNHRVITTSEIIAKSSNIGMAKISERIPNELMWNNFRDFGVGTPPLRGFPGVTAGVLRPPNQWHPIEKATMAYGYGLSVSLIQLAGAYQVLANDGIKLPLSIYHRKFVTQGVRIIASKTAKSVQRMLESAVEPGGTAAIARLSDFRVGAKTGTARKFNGEGYASGQYFALMVGIAPMSAPQIVVAIMIDTPRRGSFYGAAVAGPIFSEITSGVLGYLKTIPDHNGSSTMSSRIAFKR